MSNMPPSYPQVPPQQPMPPAPKRPQLTPEERRRKLMRSLWLLLAGSMLTLSGTPFLLSPFPLFLLLFVLVFLGIGLTIMAIVRNAQGPGAVDSLCCRGAKPSFCGVDASFGACHGIEPGCAKLSAMLLPRADGYRYEAVSRVLRPCSARQYFCIDWRTCSLSSSWGEAFQTIVPSES